MHEATMHGSIAPVGIYWLISEHRQLVNEHDQTVLKLAVAETEAANLRRQLDAAQAVISDLESKAIGANAQLAKLEAKVGAGIEFLGDHGQQQRAGSRD